ncbi:MAG: NAD(P)H-hydrate dehydratase [Paludibacteraceae bacterium]|nr:NAD(P)H-hydrate dehydratase [Paludibacteraceae bacterium]
MASFIFFCVMKLFTAKQIREIDRLTIENRNISSLDLMEEVAIRIADCILQRYQNPLSSVIFVGKGNNGGDGLAIARLLSRRGWKISVVMCNDESTLSSDCQSNFNRLPQEVQILYYSETLDLSSFFLQKTILIDALFGIGLNRNLSLYWSGVIQKINELGQNAHHVISIDFPSGLPSDPNVLFNPQTVVKADWTISILTPKIVSFMPNSSVFLGEKTCLEMSDVFDQNVIEKIETPYFFIRKENVILPKRDVFSHKGSFGHALMIGGSQGMIGALLLSAESCLRSGVGLLSLLGPKRSIDSYQVRLPETMNLPFGYEEIQENEFDSLKYDAIGIGCGLGKSKESVNIVKWILSKSNNPIVIDADALNILSEHKDLLSQIPKQSILTPHPKEWERISGVSSADRWAQIEVAQLFARQYELNIVLKGAYSVVVSSQGELFFNSTGNPGMATAGSGDVLCGMILSFLAQGKKPIDAAITGVFFHGLAGDLATKELGEYAVLASDLCKKIPQSFLCNQDSVTND